MEMLATTHTGLRGIYLWSNRQAFGGGDDVMHSDTVVRAQLPTVSACEGELSICSPEAGRTGLGAAWAAAPPALVHRGPAFAMLCGQLYAEQLLRVAEALHLHTAEPPATLHTGAGCRQPHK